MTRERSGLLLLFALFAGCGGETSSSSSKIGDFTPEKTDIDGSPGSTASDAATEEAASVLPACSWPSAFDAENTPTECRAGRTFLSCTGSLFCLGRDSEHCLSSNASPHSNCQNNCAATEFALVGYCDSSGARHPAPAGCRSVFAFPSLGSVYCCPCNP